MLTCDDVATFRDAHFLFSGRELVINAAASERISFLAKPQSSIDPYAVK